KATGTFKTESITFDSTLGQLSTPDAFEFTSEQAELYGTGIRALFNEPKKRLEYLKIAKGDRMVLHKAPERKKPEAPAPPPKPATPQTAAAAPPPPAAVPPAPVKQPLETLYRMDFAESVRAFQGTRELTADALSVWARMVDGKLPENAVANIRVVDAN